MAVVIEDSVTATETSATTTLDIEYTSAPSEGELLVSAIAVDKNSGALTGSGTGGAPAGWTIIEGNFANSISTHIAWKVAGASEGTTVGWSWTTTSGGGGAAGWAGAISGIDTGAGVDVSAENSTESSVGSLSTGTTGTTAEDDSFAIATVALDTWLSWDEPITNSNSFVTEVDAVADAVGGTGIRIATKVLTTTGTQETTFTADSGSDQAAGQIVVFTSSVGTVPTITDVEGDEDFRDKDTAITITGTNFEAAQGTGKVEISDNAVYATGTKVAQTVTSWADTSIDITAVLGTLAPGPLWMWVTNDSNNRNASGFVVTVHRAIAFTLKASANISAGGEDTTEQLEPPAGKTTVDDFDGGRIQDDENPGDTINVTDDGWREDEWCIEATTDAIVGGVYQFRLVVSDDTLLDTYTVDPRWTIHIPVSKAITGQAESLLGIAASRTGQLSARGHLVVSRTGQVESTGNILSVSRTGQLESLDTMVAARTGQAAALGHLTASRTGQVEARGAVSKSITGQAESLLSLAASRIGPAGSIESIVAARIGQAESLLGLAVSRIGSAESLSGLAVPRTGSAESIEPLLAARTGSAESLLGIAVSRIGQAASQGGTTVSKSITGQAESLSSLASERTGQVELLQPVAVAFTGSAESLLSLALARTGQASSAQSVVSSTVGAVEALLGISGARTGSAESLARALASRSGQVEAIKTIVGDPATGQVDSTLGVRFSRSGQVEASGELALSLAIDFGKVVLTQSAEKVALNQSAVKVRLDI